MTAGIYARQAGVLRLQRLEPFTGIEDPLTACRNQRGVRLDLRELALQVELALFQRADLPIKLLDFAIGPIPELKIELQQLGQSPQILGLESRKLRFGFRQMLA